MRRTFCRWLTLVVPIWLGIGWWRSTVYHPTLWIFADSGRVISITSWEGEVHLLVTNMHAGPSRSWTLDWGSIASQDDPAPPVNLRLIDDPTTIGWHHGFAFHRFEPGDLMLPTASGAIVVTPFWMWIVTTSFLPGFQLVRWIRKRRRFAAGCCQACGYDLRATPDRCPECGAPAKANAGAERASA